MASRSPEHFDPRVGDEGDEELFQPISSPSRSSHAPQERHVRLDVPPAEPSTVLGEKDLERGNRSPSDDTEKPDDSEDDSGSQIGRWAKRAFHTVQVVGEKVNAKLPFTVDLSWVLNNFTWGKIKPVIRVAVVAWICLLFIIIAKTEILLGTVSHICL